MFNLDQAIAEWRRDLATGGINSPELLDEMESHLCDDVEQQIRSGTTAGEAWPAAIGRLGSIHALRPEFEKRAATRQNRLRQGMWPVVGLLLGSFIIGARLCYFPILPLALRESIHYGSWSGLGTHAFLHKTPNFGTNSVAG